MPSARQESAPIPPAGMPATRATIPSSATPRPSEVRIRYFHAASSERALPLKPTSSADAAVVASISSQAPPRLPTSGTARRTSPERVEHGEVGVLPPAGGPSELSAPARYAGETRTVASPTTATTETSSAPAASTTIHFPTTGSLSERSSSTPSARREARRDECARDRERRHDPARRQNDEHRDDRGSRHDRPRELLAASHAASSARRCRRPRTRRRSARGTHRRRARSASDRARRRARS